MKVSLICTVLNEEKSIPALMDSILAQSRRADEVIFVDGGSRDGTVSNLQSYADKLPVQVLIEPGCNISQGRNRGIETATGEVIACTDAGVRLDPGWLEALTAPFVAHGGPDVVCGFFLADPKTAFERALGATILPDLEEIDPSCFLPSSRSVAFTREAWRDAGGYPEWLDYCEDLIFDMKLRKAGHTFAWAPRAIVYFRPRPSLRSFFRQYYCYARGDGKADLWRKRHAIRYLSYAAGLAVLVGGLWQSWLWLMIPAGATAYVHRPYHRLSRHGRTMTLGEKAVASFWVPVIRVTGDIAKMAGYPVGLWWRRKRRATLEPRESY